MRLGIASCVAAALASSGAAAAPAPPREVSALADQFFGTIKAGHAADAFRSALIGLGDSMGDEALRTASKKAADGLGGIGPISGWTPLRTTYISPDLIDQTYELKGSVIPMFFRFAIYNPGTSWRIVDIRYAPYADAEKGGYFGPAPGGAAAP